MPAKETSTQAAAALSSEIHGKSVLVTGVSPSGLGAQFVLSIALHKPSVIILAGRSAAKLAATKADILKIAPDVKLRELELDLLDEKSVRAAAEQVLAYNEPLDVLVLNAGIMAVPYKAVQWREGWETPLESQFAGNHIGHFLLTGLLVPALLKSKTKGRVVSVSSDGWRLGNVRFDDLNFDNGNSYRPFMAYGQSKTANMLFAISLAEKLGPKGLTAVSLHPGVIGSTNLSRDVEDFNTLVTMDKEQGNPQRRIDYGKFKYLTLDEGAATHVRAAYDPTLTEYNGRYLENSEVLPLEEIRAWARDSIEAEKLWKLSEDIVGEKFNW